MSKLVCSLESADCMIHRCEKCPGNDNLRNYLGTVLTAKDLKVFVYKIIDLSIIMYNCFVC